MINKLILLYLVLIVFGQGCAEKQMVQVPKNISHENVEKLKIGLTKNDVMKVLGEAYLVSPPVDKSDYEGWIYKDLAGYQRVAAVFDDSGKVIVTVFSPGEDEAENKLDFWLKEKYRQLKFEVQPSQICGRDFLPPEIYYINIERGIVIEFNGYQKYVESIKWMSSERAAKTLKKIKNCE